MDEKLVRKRRLDIKGANNIRDLGGYRTLDGGCTRWQRFLRADSLHQLYHDDQIVLLDYGVGTVIDLRGTKETWVQPNVFAFSPVVQYHHLNMNGDKGLGIEPLPQGAGRSGQIAHLYCGWLDKRQVALVRILGALADAGNHAVLYHCAWGQDRTGVISALLLGLAGVPVKTIIADYGLTARYIVRTYLTSPQADREVRNWVDYQRKFCPPEAMLLVLGHLNRFYGGVEGYVRRVGLSGDQINQLRDKLVE